jgi:hypothetical protein
LYQDNALIQSRIERTAPYFLYGDNAGKLLVGRFSPGRYRYVIEVIVNGKRNNNTIGTLACERTGIFDTFVGFTVSRYFFCARLVLLEIDLASKFLQPG